MLNAINIDHFLAQDYGAGSVNDFNTVIGSFYKSQGSVPFLVTDQLSNQRVGVFCFGVNDTCIGLFDQKNDKKYLFEFDLNDQFLLMNKRRVQQKELKYFNVRLKQLIQMAKLDAKGQAGDVGSNEVCPISIPESLAKKIGGVFGVTPTVTWFRFLNQYQDDFIRCVNRIISHTETSLEKIKSVDQLAHLFDLIKELIDSQQLNDGDCVLVTNRYRVNAKLNVVYSLFIYKESIYLVTENAGAKKTLVVDIIQKTAMLDKQPLLDTAISWVFQRFNKIASDMQSGRLDILESLKSTNAVKNPKELTH